VLHIHCSSSVNAGLNHYTTGKAIAAARKLIAHLKHSIVATTALNENQVQLNIKNSIISSRTCLLGGTQLSS